MKLSRPSYQSPEVRKAAAAARKAGQPFDGRQAAAAARAAGRSAPQLSQWYVAFDDHHDQRRRLRAFSDKGESENFGRMVEKLVGLRAMRQMPDAAMTLWLEDLSDYHRAKLASWGLLDARLASLSDPLAVHAAAYHAALVAKGDTDEHADLRKSRVLAVLEGCQFTYWRDVDAGGIESWLADERRAGRLKQRTSNHYVTAVKGFCAWMVRSGRAGASPLTALGKLTVADEQRKGVFTPEQVAALLAHCQAATDVWGFNQRRVRSPDDHGPQPQKFLTGPQRAMVYKFAVETALREGSIRALTVGQVRIDRDDRGNVTGGTVRTTAGQQKTRKSHDVPLRRAFAAELARDLAGLAPAVRPFAGLTEYAAAMLRNDLFNAGLPMVDEDGLPLMFHSFRATCATWLGEAGMSSTDIASVTGHRTRAILDHYTHATKRAGRRAIESLPELPVLRATGTDGVHDAGMRASGPAGARSGRSMPLLAIMKAGQVAERLKAPVSKTGRGLVLLVSSNLTLSVPGGPRPTSSV